LVRVITYAAGIDGLRPEQLDGFFDGWASYPSCSALLRILGHSAVAVLAYDGDQVVGFVNALSDGELAAYIPLLEVRAAYRGRGIGTELVRRVMAELDGCYMVDAVCDAEVAPFYERLDMVRLAGMARRNRAAGVLTEHAHGDGSP
jgi:ribosomal protein S18 acetylase RimI-like enzyme